MQLYRARCYFAGNFFAFFEVIVHFYFIYSFLYSLLSVICYGFPFILLKISLKEIYVVCTRGAYKDFSLRATPWNGLY